MYENLDKDPLFFYANVLMGNFFRWMDDYTMPLVSIWEEVLVDAHRLVTHSLKLY